MKTMTIALSLLLGIFTVNGSAMEQEQVERAILAGGCFWCVEAGLEKLDGVKEVVSGYTGGQTKNPTYKQVGAGVTGHTEAVEVLYNSKVISYAQLLDEFWKIMDPTDAGGQFVDRGDHYRSGIFYLNEEQRVIAEQSRRNLEENGPFERPIVTEISEAGVFYPAEDYHQDYYRKNPLRYRFYTSGSGRTEFAEKHWGKMK